MHSIKSDASYEEEEVPDSPLRKTRALDEGTAALPVIGHVPGNADSSLLVRPHISHEREKADKQPYEGEALPIVGHVPGDANSSLHSEQMPSSGKDTSSSCCL